MVDIYLYAFDRATGQRVWVFQGEPESNPANSNPAANDSLVFTGSGGGITWALRAATGDVVWRRPAPLPYPVLAVHPVVSEDLVFIGYTEPGAGERGALAALDARTGAVSWLHDFVPYVSSGQDAGCYGNVVVSQTTVYAWIGRGDVIALGRETGALQWHRPATHGLLGRVRRPLALVQGVLVVGSTDGHLEGLDPATGQQLWSRQLSYGSLNEPFVEDGTTVFVTVGGGHVAAIDPTTGATRWSRGLDGRSESLGLWGPGAVDRERVYIGGSEGLFAFKK
jgi:outer membrane protein assembly factor BamB